MRLTMRKGKAICCSAFEKGECHFEYCEQCDHEAEAWSKLTEYEDLEEQGLLLRLPVPEGTMVYKICRTVIYGEVGDKGEFNYFWHRINFDRKMIEDWGKTVFLTKEEAEEALRRMEGKVAE